MTAEEQIIKRQEKLLLVLTKLSIEVEALHMFAVENGVALHKSEETPAQTGNEAILERSDNIGEMLAEIADSWNWVQSDL